MRGGIDSTVESDFGDHSNEPLHQLNVDSLELLELDAADVAMLQETFAQFVKLAGSQAAAGELLYQAITDAASSLHELFVTPASQMAMRVLVAIDTIIAHVDEPKRLKQLVEGLAFQHLQIDVTINRFVFVSQSIIEVISTELSDAMTSHSWLVWKNLLDYIGGAMIFVRSSYGQRIDLILTSWSSATSNTESNMQLEGTSSSSSLDSEERKKLGADFDAQAIPTTYTEMFKFNAAVMGFSLEGHAWMFEVLDAFDNIVTNVAHRNRLNEECDFLALRIAKVAQAKDVELPEYKSCMLAALRSLLPKQWSTEHEVAWTWLWEVVQGQLVLLLPKVRKLHQALARFFGSLDEHALTEMKKATYVAVFEAAPATQDFFKQSYTRLHYIAGRIMEMTTSLYEDPVKMGDDLSALGLRHVAYNVPTDLFMPLIQEYLSVVQSATEDPDVVEAYSVSLGLLARILIRTVAEGSTIVMQAINRNSESQLRRAVRLAPRGSRATCMLTIQVGKQNISPLEWAIESGSLEAARAILQDLLTIRADREQYYYGVEELFTRHHDIVRRLCSDAPPLLPVLLEGLIWRSRLTTNGMRRVNYYVKHLIVDAEGGTSNALKWIANTKDPRIICHPCVILVSDTTWRGVVVRQFILSKVWFIVSLAIFMMSQAILPNVADSSGVIAYAVLAGRAVNYILSMGRLFISHVSRSLKSYRLKDTFKVMCIRLPGYLVDMYLAASLVLLLLLVLMLTHEPMLYCIEDQQWPIIQCEASEGIESRYEVFSMCAMAIHWLLLVDLTVFSTKLSAFLLVLGNVFSEVTRFMVALAFLLGMFGSAISVLPSEHAEYRDLQNSCLTLFAITVGLYEKHYTSLQSEPVLMTNLFVFSFVASIILLNLLIAQLNCTYEEIYADMVGFARLSRAQVIVERLAECPAQRWETFVEGLSLDKKLEFNEGDVGLPGGIASSEPASNHVVNVESVIRYGGASSPETPWPEEEFDKLTDEDRLEQLEKMVKKAAHGMGVYVSRTRGRHRDRDSEDGSGDEATMSASLSN